MAKKELNVFNVSFLDLLSGALGAVLILFVIVPKLDSKIRAQLQELESFQNLEIEVKDIQKMVSKLDNSVSKDIVTSLQAKISSITSAVGSTKEELNQMQIQLAKCDDEKNKLATQVTSLSKRIDELRKQLKSNDTTTEDLRTENITLKNQVEALEAEKRKASSDLASALNTKTDLESQNSQISESMEAQAEAIADKQKELDALQNELEQYKEENDNLKNKIAEASKNQGTEEDRTGVKFSDKNVVFVLDVSGSMEADPEPDKLKDVKAGLKMLIATMDEKYKVDIIIYPYSPTEDYKYLYGKLMPVTPDLKYTIYKHMNRLYARNCTPTRSVMEFVFNHPAYKEAGTITFLSDGLPTRTEPGSTDCPNDPTSKVLAYIKELNGGKKTINAIGVGSEYRTKSSHDPKVKFMKDMSQQNGGFYIGF